MQSEEVRPTNEMLHLAQKLVVAQHREILTQQPRFAGWEAGSREVFWGILTEEAVLSSKGEAFPLLTTDETLLAEVENTKTFAN